MNLPSYIHYNLLNITATPREPCSCVTLAVFLFKMDMNNNLIEYRKPLLNYQAQLEKFQDRGLLIDDWQLGLTTLLNINYYRLSAYCLPFKQRDHLGRLTEKFQQGTALSDVLAFYEFDRKLRLLVMDAMERIEISIRTNVTYHLSTKYGAFALEDHKNFHESFGHSKWLLQIKEEVTRSRERFIEHYKEKYRGFPSIPVWMATEVMSFGSLSLLYKGLSNYDKRTISDFYSLHPKTLANWLHFLTYVRNICAHHGRLWNKELAIKPKLDELNKLWPTNFSPKNDRSFIILSILKYLLHKAGNGKEWSYNCHQLITPILSQYHWAHTSMDIPENWLQYSF